MSNCNQTACGSQVFFPGKKRQTNENDHSPSGKVQNAWSYSSTPSCLHGVDMPTSYPSIFTKFTIWEISCYSLNHVVDTVWHLKDNKTPARILITGCDKLYRCTVQHDIMVHVHQLMHLFISLSLTLHYTLHTHQYRLDIICCHTTA